ncbi:hypothetical protein G9A89_013189 [Geosiphon pyriformis]|nr:hypothetical protein G9A89_013189 [Geosiphon pyriformis]
MGLLFTLTAEIIPCIILQRTSTNPNLNMAESENIGANHLEFVKFLFQQYSQQLELNSNHYPTESVFNFYINNRITKCLEGTVNIEAARENFYTELFQHTNLPRNYSFAPIIREINQTIKRRIQTPAATPKGIQLLSWKKHRVESPTAPSYYYTPGSTINILSANAFISNAILTGHTEHFGIATLWELSEKEEKKELEDQEFTYQNLITKNPEVETPNFQAQQSLNLENSEIETLNHQRQNNPNPELSNQQNLPLVIIIDQLPINPPFQLPPQQPVQQQSLQQPPQQSNLDPMAYAPIAKLDNFTDEEDDTQDTVDAWYQNLAVKLQNFNDFKMKFIKYFSNNNSINKLANFFTTIKQGNTEAVTTYLGRFHRNLRQIQAIQADYFTVPQILNQFIRDLHSNLLQRVHPMHPVDLPTTVIHARDFEAAELEANHAQAVNLVMNRSSELDSKLKQFSKSINQKLERYLADNHAIYQTPQRCHNSGNANRFQNQSQSSSLTTSSLLWQPEMHACHNCGKQGHIRQLTIRKSIQKSRSLVPNSESLSESRLRLISNYLPANNAATNLLTTSISTFNLSIAVFSNLSTAASSNLLATAPNNLSVSTINSNTTPKLSYDDIRKPETQNFSSSSHQSLGLHSQNLGTGATQNLTSQHYLSLLVTPEDTLTSNQKPTQKQQTLTSNILPAIVTNDELLAVIFPFEIEEPSSTPLFSKAALDEKPITAMYTDAKVDGQSIKLILDSGLADIDRAASARIITADKVTKTPIGKINDFPFEVNGIVTLIKVLVIEATQYQALVDNDWLSKVNAMLDWNIQEFQLTYQSQHIHVLAMCGHFKTPPKEKLLIELEKEKEKPTWEAYQVSWADANHNELPPILP